MFTNELPFGSNRFSKIDPAPVLTKEECQKMIDDAMRKHNRNASMISAIVGFVILALFADGLLHLVGVIPPLFPWLDISLECLAP